MDAGKLYLIPNVISERTQQEVIPLQAIKVLPSIQHFLAEDIRTARRFLSSLKIYPSIEPLQFEVLDKDTKQDQLQQLLQPISEGKNVGVISESGCPGVADPGALAVQYAHRNRIQVIPLVGPSSLLMALMASGLNGQGFAFHGYLPIDIREAAKAVRDFEQESKEKNQTQIFIETPYRNNRLLEILLKTLRDTTLLSISIDITGSQETIQTLYLKEWKTRNLVLPKMPSVFLFIAT